MTKKDRAPIERRTQEQVPFPPVSLPLGYHEGPRLPLVFYWAAGTLLVGTIVYRWLEGWTFLDALYFSMITLATIGYGDLTPTTPIAKVFTMFYAINGIVVLLALFDRIRRVRVQRHNEVKRQRDEHSQAKEL